MTFNAHFEVQATIALNQLAISMMNASCYEDAFETFKAAALTLQIAIDSPTSKEGRKIVSSKLEKAMESCALLSKNVNLSSSIVPLFVVPHNANTFQSSTTAEFTLIRIDEHDHSLYTGASFNLLSAMVLHNLAVSSLCVNRFNTNSSYCSDQNSLSILQLAHELLEKAASTHEALSTLADNSHNNTSDTNPSFDTAPLVFFMTLIVLQTLQRLFEILGHKEHAFACITRLAHVRNVAAALSETVSAQSFARIAAAA